MNVCRRALPVATLLLLAASALRTQAGELTRVPTRDGVGRITVPADGVERFLAFGDNIYAPDGLAGEDGTDLSGQLAWGNAVFIALFQDLRAREVVFPAALVGREIQVTRAPRRDEFWDQIITVGERAVVEAPRYERVEAGRVGEALPPGVRGLGLSADEIRAQRDSLLDPHIPQGVDRELTWEELEALAFPLDFQKVLLASLNDSSPGFVYQNGQWLTTWPGRDLPEGVKEDHWFAPALLMGERLVRPAPLAARTGFVESDAGRTLPMWTLTWRYGDATVRQWIFSQPTVGGGPCVHVRLRVDGAPPGTRLALGVGRRPNAHYWDDRERERTPIPFWTLPAGYQRRGRQLIDRWDRRILESDRDFELEDLGLFEQLVTFPADETAVCLRAPQTETAALDGGFSAADLEEARATFEDAWERHLQQGAQASLPSPEWMRRVDIWRSQIAAITRVRYQGQERLAYGAYFYQAYFGPEEGWPIVAHALWGLPAEARRQAEIMLSPENRSKDNVHHQARNGVFAWYAAEVARLSDDREWLTTIAPALIDNAEWTIAARQRTAHAEPPVTRGLLPPHIYGGDIRDPATSLYASAVCLKGLRETADVFRTLGPESLAEHARRYEAEADDLHARLSEVVAEVADRSTKPPFLPLALALPSLDGRNEGPYDRLTASRLGNYWNLFAPQVLELGLVTDAPARVPNAWLLGYMETHGGLWASLPRFHAGLDAAYSLGIIKELLARSAADPRYRNQALAALQSFFLHAASRNGYTIPEVAGLFPYRLDATAYERLVRESPWSFGMYSAESYLGAHISFTEPLGAAAGEALWLVRNALVQESRDARGRLDGGLFLLSAVPSDWFAEGREIRLDDFPTAYGTLSLSTRSRVDSTGEIEVDYRFEPNRTRPLESLVLRVVPPGSAPLDTPIPLEPGGTIRIRR